jgi:hypothetical protein
MRKQTKNQTDEYTSFETALKKVLSVTPSELKAKIEAKKRKRSKPPSASRALTSQD